MTFQEWLEDQHADPASTAWRSNADHLAMAYAAGREAMLEECADFVVRNAGVVPVSSWERMIKELK